MRRIIADENIPLVREAFAELGVVRTLPGREITAASVREAEMLLVRSVTRVDRDLLENSGVRFVGTATIGFDHVDRDYLDAADITFASAPGSNANSVSEWVTAALLELCLARGLRLQDLTLGIVGVGNVGGRVRQKALALGLRVLLNDPPRARREGDGGFSRLEDLLRASDVVSVHVPLNRAGEDRTLGLVDADFLRAMRPGAIFINSSRGAVVDEDALRAALAAGRPAAAVLDVWQGEPAIDPRTLAAVELGTPHIAGYSFDGKVAGTSMLRAAACSWLGVDSSWDPAPLLPPPEVEQVALDNGDTNPEPVLARLVRRVYTVNGDHRRLLRMLKLPAPERGAYFTRLRKEYPRRREFEHTRVRLRDPDSRLAAMVRGLGFRVEE